MNEAERRLRFMDGYVAAAFAALRLRVIPSEDETECYVALFIEEAETFYGAYRRLEAAGTWETVTAEGADA